MVNIHISSSACILFSSSIALRELLPIVIVFVGAENMFNLVDAVGRTSVTLTVKQRIAEGLSRAGTSNTLKVVSYNSILGVLAVFSAGSIRQFCVFSIVVLVAHWFLAHTFFLAVLSIDMQRLEVRFHNVPCCIADPMGFLARRASSSRFRANSSSRLIYSTEYSSQVKFKLVESGSSRPEASQWSRYKEPQSCSSEFVPTPMRL